MTNSIFIGDETSKVRDVLAVMVRNGNVSIADISREINLSIPTVTKSVGELIDQKLVSDYGKTAQQGSRRSSVYGLNADYGVIVCVYLFQDSVRIGTMDFCGRIIHEHSEPMSQIDNNEESLGRLCDAIKRYIASRKLKSVLAVGLSIGGRVDAKAGYSYTMLYFGEHSLVDKMSEQLEYPVYIENDTRAMTYAEYLAGDFNDKQTIVFANISWGFGIGMIINGKLFYGKSGFGGEFGHIVMLDNQVLCRCGKRGCMETVVSGIALHRQITESLENGAVSSLAHKYAKANDVSFDDILEAVRNEDTLAIEVLENVGAELGRCAAAMINIFNPDAIVVGGSLAMAKNVLMPPMRSGVVKYSLNLVSRDTTIYVSKLGEQAGLLGTGLITRSKVLGIL